MATKQGFEHSFSSGDFYNKQTQDEHHLKNILDFLPLKADMKILDLGKDTAFGFDELLKKHDKKIVEGYELEVVRNEIYITEQVNILFCKR